MVGASTSSTVSVLRGICLAQEHISVAFEPRTAQFNVLPLYHVHHTLLSLHLMTIRWSIKEEDALFLLNILVTVVCYKYIFINQKAIYEPNRDKNGFLPMRKQRRTSASQ